MKYRIAFFSLILALLPVSIPGFSPAQEASETVRKIVTKVVPQYPPLARSMNITGTVRVEVVVAPNGSVKSLEVKGGHPVLADSAQNALRQWKWSPSAHETHESIELRFNP
jgi:TonB family protein